MFNIELDWKKEILSGDGSEENPYVYGDSFNVDLEDIEVWMRANAGEHYCGNGAGEKLTLWFAQEPSQEIKDAINAYWNGITPASPEANYVSHEQKLARVEEMKLALVSKTWDQMSVGERKIVLNQMPTKAELGF